MTLRPETLNAWRIVPRLLVSLYGVMLYQVAAWYMGLPSPSTQQAAFVSTVVGAAPAFFGLYVNSGNNGGRP